MTRLRPEIIESFHHKQFTTPVIGVTGGKGGVGKSSFTAAIGTILAEELRVVLADTDVDAPNLHLVLGAVLESSEDISASEKAFIDYDLCSRCMICVDICRFSAITGDEEPVIINYSCEGCSACALSCPVYAIEIQPVINGRLNLVSWSHALLIGFSGYMAGW